MLYSLVLFFFNDTATTEIYTLSLHDALPICSSGFILSVIMCRAMNRSFTNVLFGGFGQVQQASTQVEERTVRSAAPDEAAEILEAASSVIIVPGYGMAVAQAQHKVRELADVLTSHGIDVKFAIHPVAGRMPG